MTFTLPRALRPHQPGRYRRGDLFLVVGMLCPAIRGGVGAISSQAFVNFGLRTLGLNLLAQTIRQNRPWR